LAQVDGARKSAEIAAEAATDGLYVVRTSLPEATLGDAETVVTRPTPVQQKAFDLLGLAV